MGVGVGKLPVFVSWELGIARPANGVFCTVSASNRATSSVYRSRRVLKAVSVSEEVSVFSESVGVSARTGVKEGARY